MRNDYPQIVGHYVNATKKIFDKDVWVPTLDFGKFRVLEDDLREIGASSKDYAYTVLSVLQQWTRDKHMDHVPINVFCGKFAFGKFLKVKQSKTVVIEDSSDAELKHSERMVAEMYIAKHIDGHITTTIDDVVNEIRPVLSLVWLEMYESDKYRKCYGEVIDELCEEYGVVYAKDYLTLVGEILKNARKV